MFVKWKWNKEIKSNQIKSNKFYDIFNVKIVFQNTRRIKSFFPYKDKLAPSFQVKSSVQIST